MCDLQSLSDVVSKGSAGPFCPLWPPGNSSSIMPVALSWRLRALGMAFSYKGMGPTFQDTKSLH